MVDTISFSCTTCDANLHASGSAAGKTTLCHICGTAVKVPAMFEGPPIAYDDAPPAPNIFTPRPLPVERTSHPLWQYLRIGAGIGIAGAAVALISYSIRTYERPVETSPVSLTVQASAPPSPSGWARPDKTPTAPSSSASIDAATRAAAQATEQARREIEQLQRDKQRLQREHEALAAKAAQEAAAAKAALEKAAAAKPTTMPGGGSPSESPDVAKTPAPEVAQQPPVTKPTVPEAKAPPPSAEQLQKDLRQANAEALVARSKRLKVTENLALVKSRLSIDIGEIERAEAAIAAQERKTALLRATVGVPPSRIATSVAQEEQFRLSCDRLRSDNATRKTRQEELEIELLATEEECAASNERLNTIREQIKQAASGGVPSQTVSNPTGKTPSVVLR